MNLCMRRVLREAVSGWVIYGASLYGIGELVPPPTRPFNCLTTRAFIREEHDSWWRR